MKILIMLHTILICFVALSQLTACQHISNEYKTLTLKEGIAKLSFEYPHEWRISLIDTRTDYTEIRLFAPTLKKYNTTILASSMDILVYKPDDIETNIDDLLTNTVAKWRDETNFQLLSCSDLQIDGHPAVQKTCSHDLKLVDSTTHQFTENTETIITREIYFFCQDNIWNITISLNADASEENAKGISHILETFKVID